MNGLIAVPVYNESQTLATVIHDLKGLFPVENLLFIDDGSHDGSGEILKTARVAYLRHPVNLGYEETLKTAMHYTLAKKFSYVVFFDADGQHRIGDLENIINTFAEGEYDFILGSRYKNQKQQQFSLRGLGTKVFSFLTTLYTHTRITDSTSGLKLLSRDFIPFVLGLPAEDMHAELIAALARHGARIHEVMIEINPRIAGDSMYSVGRSLFYPARTLLCLVAGSFLTKKEKLYEYPK